MRIQTIVLAVTCLALPAPARAQSEEHRRIENAAAVLGEVLNIPDNVPADVLDKAECVIVLPSVVKFAIGVGGSYGRGVMTCRGGAGFDGPWGAPSMMMLASGSIGLQLGGQATDFVLFVMNPRGAGAILSSQVKLGADLSAAAGPKGRTLSAATDATMRAEILSYSRARGLFAGISLEGSSLRADEDGNEHVYGSRVAARDIVITGKVPPPAAAKSLLATLNEKSPKNRSEK
jgi:lipid-binding SYLF domain-containing protein